MLPTLNLPKNARVKVTKEKAPELRRRRGRIKKIKVTVFGFKIWVVWDPNSGLPIAMRFATIETSDVTLAGKRRLRERF